MSRCFSGSCLLEVLPHERVVDNGDARRALDVLLGERASALNRNAERPEVVRRDHVEARTRTLPRIAHRLADDRERHAEAGARDRHARSGGDAAHAGDRAHAIEELSIERVDLLRILQPLRRHRQEEGEQVIGAKAQIDVGQADDAADGEAGAGEERERERELRHDEGAPRPVPARADRRSSRFLQDVVQVPARDLPRGRAAEHQARQHRHAEREEQHAHVQAHVGFGGQRAIGHQRHDHLQEDVGEGEADHAADRRQHDALGEELGEEATSGRAHRRTDRHFALPRRAAREQQVGDVGARDQQHEPDRAEHHPQRGHQVRREEVVLERLDAGAPAGVRCGELLGDLFRDGHHVGIGLRQRHPALETPHDQQPVEIVVDLLRLEGERQEQLLVQRSAAPGASTPTTV